MRTWALKFGLDEKLHLQVKNSFFFSGCDIWQRAVNMEDDLADIITFKIK